MLKSLVSNNTISINFGGIEPLVVVTPFIKSNSKTLYIAMDDSGLICVYADKPIKYRSSEEWDNLDTEGNWLDYSEIAQYDGVVSDDVSNTLHEISNPFFYTFAEHEHAVVNF